MGQGLIPEGIYKARLAGVRRFASAFGDRVGFEFEILEGQRAGEVIMQSAAPSVSTKGKLASLVRGILGREPSDNELHEADTLVGSQCKVLVRQERNREGKTYSAIAQAFQ